MLLSALAEGADRLVARLVPVLPMSGEEYEQTFPATDDELRGLLHGNNTLQPIVIPSATNDRANATDPTALQRLPAGVFIARRCQILIAVGDGQHDAETDKAGPIAQMVKFKREGELALSTEQSPYQETAGIEQLTDSVALDFERNLRELEALHHRFMAALRRTTLADLKRKIVLSQVFPGQAPHSADLLLSRWNVHFAVHRGQIRTLRNLYWKTRGEQGLFFPQNPMFRT